MRRTSVAKITISLPKDMLDVADRLAQEMSTTRSGIIADLLKREERARVYALMEEGYREMAEESRRFAEETFPQTIEMIFRIEWDETAND